MKPSTAISAGLVMLGMGSVLFAFATAPRLTLAGVALMVIGAGIGLGGALARWGR